MSNPLTDQNFLSQLDLQTNKTIYARLISITSTGAPVECLEGRVTGGSINVDGKANLRRSCSISLVGQDLNITDFYWALKSRFKVEIGVQNTINTKYENIIWFKQGVFVVNSFSYNHTATGLQISISGQDKMCLLNGSLGGAMSSETVFDSYDEYDTNGHKTIKKLPIKDILIQALQTYAKEPLSNIIINDLDYVNGYELWNYRGSTPLYYFYKIETSGNYKLINVTFNNNTKVYKEGSNTAIQLADLKSSDFYIKGLISGIGQTGTKFRKKKDSNVYYKIVKVKYGEDAGYRKTDLIYPSDLILQVGAPLTELFDKIKTMLGAYEYFYDVEGRFVFQKQKTYTQGVFSPIATNKAYVLPASTLSQYSYRFDTSVLISSYSNSPSISNIKNDFAIWGTKTSVAGGKIPVHGRFAIEKKPTKYVNFANQTFSTSGNNKVDWREIIYQMALDHMNHRNDKNFTSKLIENNPEFYTGSTGYEQYYIDLLGFWRQIYDGQNFLVDFIDPSSLVFWIDFLEPYGELEQFSNKTLGNRCKAENNNNIKSMWYSEIPEVEFIVNNTGGSLAGTSSYQQVNITNDLYDLFTISSRGKSVFDVADEMINSYILNTSTISITSLPIYYIQPNTLIYVEDKESGIKGDYILNNYSIPLTYNGTMSISATKVINNIV